MYMNGNIVLYICKLHKYTHRYTEYTSQNKREEQIFKSGHNPLVNKMSRIHIFEESLILPHRKTRAPIEVWKCNFHTFLKNVTDRPKDKPTNQQTSQPTERGFIGKLLFQ